MRKITTAKESSSSDPCLILDGLLVLSLDNPKDCQFILAVERDLEGFYRDARRSHMEIEPANSYYRLLVHRVARFYGLDHFVDPYRKTVIIISRNSDSRLPLLRLSELAVPSSRNEEEEQEEETSCCPIPENVRILKRKEGAVSPLQPPSAEPDSSAAKMTVEERQEAYERARERIFNNNDEPTVEVEVPKVKCDIAPCNNADEPSAPVIVNGWNLAAAEFTPTAPEFYGVMRSSSISAGYSKPEVVDTRKIPPPQHILLVSSGGVPFDVGAMRKRFCDAHSGDFRARGGSQTGLVWFRTVEAAQKALVSFTDGLFRLEPWKPVYYSEPFC